MKSDRDISVSEWNAYLKKYKDNYQLKTVEQCWSIRLNKYRGNDIGFIQPYSIVKKQLVCVLSFETKQQCTFFLKRIPDDFVITQRGDTDLSVLLPESELRRAESVFNIRKRMKISKKERERRRIHALKMVNQIQQ